MRAKLKALALVLISLASGASGQSLSVYNVNRTQPAVTTASVRVVDKDGKSITGLTAADFVVTENGKVRKVITFDCPPPTPVTNISAAVSFDVSGSMSESYNGARSTDYAKTTFINLVNALTMPPAEVALQRCDDRAEILLDFTTNRADLFSKLAWVEPEGSNDFTEHLLNQNNGLLWVAAAGKYKRYAILLTDAYFGKLPPATVQRCLQVCSQFDITLYAVLFNDQRKNNDGVRASLQEVADATGGWVQDGIVTVDQAKELAMQLSGELSGAPPCRIEWESGKTCDPVVVTEISIPKYNLSTSITRRNSFSSGYAEIAPPTMRFGKVDVPFSGESKFKIKAKNGDVLIRSITTTHPSLSIKGNLAPFTLIQDNEKEITVLYTPTDTSFVSGYVKIDLDYCDDSIIFPIPVSAGVPPVYNLKLTRPIGGEVYVAGEDTVITWTGVDASDPIKLEYSTDGGVAWSTIADTAYGLRYFWQVPLPASTKCKVRATLIEDFQAGSMDFTLINRFPVLDSIKASPTYAELSPDNKQLMVTSQGLQLYDAATAKLLYTDPTLWTSKLIPPVYAGNNLIVGCSGSTIWGLNTTIGSQQVKWTKTSKTFNSLTVSPSQVMVATTSQGGSTEVWNALTGAKIHDLLGHLRDATYAVFNPYSTRLATASLDGTARVWDMTTGLEIQKLAIDGALACSGIAFHPANYMLYTASEVGKMQWWDIASATSMVNIDLGMTSPNRLAVNNQASIVLAGSNVNVAGRVLEDSAGIFNTNLSIGDGFTTWSMRPPMTKDGELVLFRPFGSPTDVAVWDTKGKLIVGQMPHPKIARSATFSQDEHYIVTTTDREAFLWSITAFGLPGKKVDTTAPFTVVAPQAASLDVDMGTVIIGSTKDSTITAYITNTGTYKVRVDSLSISGANASDFVLQSLPPPTIDPGQFSPVEFAFSPSATGLRTATVTIHTRSTPLVQTITGTGISPFLETLGNIVDFGILPLGTPLDSTVTAAVKNVGTSPIDILSADILGPDTDQFSIISGGGAFTLQPGEVHAMVLRFLPGHIGRSSSNIGFAYSGVGSPAILRMFGQGIGGSVYIPNDSGSPGDVVRVALLLKGARDYIRQDGATKFDAEISFDASVLTPASGRPSGTISNGVQTIAVSDTWQNLNDTLTIVAMRVGLGASQMSALTISSFTWLDDFGKQVPVSVNTESGMFKLLGLCEEGGKRLFNPSGEVRLSVEPNPSSGEKVTLEYETIEDGRSTLRIYNALGSMVHEILADGPQHATSEFSATQLANGLYYCILQTPTVRLKRSFYISK